MNVVLREPARSAWRALGLFSLVSIAMVPLSAHADRGECDLSASGARLCGSAMGCATRADCIEGPGTEDETCQTIVSAGGTGRECLHDCSTLFTCTSTMQCPTVNGIGPTCSPVGPPTGGPSICTWTTSVTSIPPAQQISYCTPPGNHVPEAQITLCHRVAGALGTFTTDYYRGDCDGDGCPNGHDSDPCMAPATGGSCTATREPFDSPFCAPLPALACIPTATGPTCGDARPCNPSPGATLACPIGACEAGWSDVARCRPPCGTLFLCRTSAGGPTPEQCPLLGTASGTCVRLPGGMASVSGRDGMCVYPGFTDATCPGTAPDAACFVDPAGNSTSNFFAGDCDDDGAPNACDTMICGGGGGTSVCRVGVPSGCTPNYVPPSDAGVDAGSDGGINVTDAGPTDAGDTDAGATDAGSPVDSGSDEDAASTGDAATPIDSGRTTTDSGSASGDAASTADGGSAAGFSGGGGCRCAAAGTGSRPWAGTALATLALVWTWARRRRSARSRW